MTRILHILSSLDNGGIEKMLYDYYKKLHMKGYIFDFIVHGPSIGRMETQFEDLGSKIYHVTPKRDNFIKNQNEVKKIILNGKYDAIHSHMSYLSFLNLRYAKKSNTKVRIAHAHNARWIESRVSKITRILGAKFTNFYATNLLACSRDTADWIWEPYCSNEKIDILVNAIEIDNYLFNKDQREELRIEMNLENSLVIGNVARFTNQKNHKFLIETFSELIGLIPNAKLLLVGTGEMQNDIREKVSQYNLSDKVIFLGGRNDVQRLYNCMDVFVLPSKYEGLGIVVVEAQVNGLKCFVSDVVPQEVEIDKSIEFLPIKNPKNWSEKIAGYLTNIPNRNINTNEINYSKYDIQKSAENLIKIYETNLRG